MNVGLGLGVMTSPRYSSQTSQTCPCMPALHCGCRYDFFNDIPHTDRFGRKFKDPKKLRFYKGDSNVIAFDEAYYHYRSQ